MDAGGPIVSGHRFMKLEEYHAAIAQYAKAIELEPNNPDGYKGRGQAYFQLGKNKKALEDFNMAVKLEKIFPAECHYYRGIVYLKMGKYEEAFQDMNKAVNLSPEISITYIGRARLYIVTSKFQKALEDLNKSIELDSKCSENAYFLRGTLWYLKQDYDKALSDFDEALRMNHQFAEVYYHRSLAHERIEEITKAIADMKKYIQLRPDDSKSVVRLIKLTTKYLKLQEKKEQKKIPAKDEKRI